MIIFMSSSESTGSWFCLREANPDHFSCFFIKLIRGGGSFPFIKIYVVDFIYSGGLWQHEIGIEKVF